MKEAPSARAVPTPCFDCRRKGGVQRSNTMMSRFSARKNHLSGAFFSCGYCLSHEKNRSLSLCVSCGASHRAFSTRTNRVLSGAISLRFCMHPGSRSASRHAGMNTARDHLLSLNGVPLEWEASERYQPLGQEEFVNERATLFPDKDHVQCVKKRHDVVLRLERARHKNI